MSFKSKFREWLEKVKNPKPEQLIITNIQGYILQTIAIISITIYIFVFRRDYWFLAVFLIFNLFNLYTNLVTAFQQLRYYKNLNEHFDDDKREELEKIKEIKSPHMRKDRYIIYAFGKKVKVISIITSLILAYFLATPNFSVGRVFRFLLAYYLIHYLLYYIISYKFAMRKIKLSRIKRENEKE